MMNNDIVPELLDKIQKHFNILFKNNKKIAIIQSKISKGTASYLDAQTYAIEVGEMLAKSFEEYIVPNALPDGKMYYNIAERILTPTLGNNHDLISAATLQIQDILNSKAGLGLKGVEVPFYQNKVTSIVNRISNEEKFEDVAWILDEPVITFSQNVVDEILKANVEFQAKSGMKPTITRSVHGHDPCDWCLGLAGAYEYPDVPRDVYRRHDRCKCSVNYDPGENKKQNVWTKEWITEEEKKQIEFRKNYGL